MVDCFWRRYEGGGPFEEGWEGRNEDAGLCGRNEEELLLLLLIWVKLVWVAILERAMEEYFFRLRR